MRRYIALILCLLLCFGLWGCTKPESEATTESTTAETPESPHDGVHILLSDNGITVDGNAASDNNTDAVYVAKDIIYYEDGKDFTYGDGDESDAHTQEEAYSHTVVHITQPGQYVLSGTLSKGQIAVDLGSDAKNDPSAVVTLLLDGVNITSTVAPAIIFYNVYECGNTDTESASATVDTSTAGANVILASGTENNIHGAYVAKIYKPGSVELSSDGTKVENAKKLHKYDGAFYSKMSMNISGDGTLNITAANEGLDTELHLTINGGNINIVSGNDGINTNEDNVSVTTINGGKLNILVDGSTGEGDGIDSNGWLVINGGTVIAQACGFSGDAGIDSDKGIHINGGFLFATGNMLDHISDSKQNFAVFQFSSSQRVSMYAEDFRSYTLQDSNGKEIISSTVDNDFSYLIMSSPNLSAGEYTLWQGKQPLAGTKVQQLGMGGGMFSGGQMPGGMTPPTGMPPQEKPEGTNPPGGFDPSHNGPNSGPNNGISGEVSNIFNVEDGSNYFAYVTEFSTTQAS